MKAFTFRIGIVGTLFSIIPLSVFAETEVEHQLREFHRNPKEFMTNHSNVQKFRQHYETLSENPETGEVIERLVKETKIEDEKDRVSFFSEEEINLKEFVTLKNKYHEGHQKTRKALEASQIAGREAFDAMIDNPATLISDPIKLNTLEDMEDFRSARLSESPWASDYWPIYGGMLAKRYTDSGYKSVLQSRNWLKIKTYLEKNSSSVDDLSPAEKYDLLIGDENKTLTRKMLEAGLEYADADGRVETWMGICHGWAQASFMERRPSHAIQVLAWDNRTKITFYPDDIKALASLLWAKSAPKANFVGARCNIKDPQVDENGRIIDKSCRDTNPATWHLSVVNMLGYYKRSFVLDATYDYEVWNQPAYAYEYTYFNPQTGDEVRRLKDAIVSIDDFTKDKFRAYRDKRAQSVVGIAMKFIYIAETPPTHVTSDNQSRDRRVAVHYLYDLELDSDGKIIGGEWYHQQHPDFLWGPPVNSRALSVGDSYLDSLGRDIPGFQAEIEHTHRTPVWTQRHKTHIPSDWRDAALRASSPSGQPLARIVQELVQKSNQTDIWFFGLRPRHINSKSTGIEKRYYVK